MPFFRPLKKNQNNALPLVLDYVLYLQRTDEFDRKTTNNPTGAR